jgi:uncharacterized protein (DUF362 family)
MTNRSQVAALLTKPETVLKDYERLLDLAGVQDALDPKAATILKDNISWHYPFPSANTTPWQLEGTIMALRKAGFTDLSCVQNETVVINTFKGEDLNLYSPIFRSYCIPVLYNFKEQDMTWVPYEPQGEMLVLHDIYPDGIHIPDYLFGKNIVHLPTVKCHIYTTTTGAMKNAFGGLLPEVKNVILASADQVAIDAVAAKMMGFDPLSIDYIRLAHERGLGVGDVREIELVGDDLGNENWHFEVGRSFHKFLGWLGWYGPTKVLQRLVFRTPLVNIPIFISEFNHDYVHWPLKERKIYLRWRETTPWGQLFDRYEKAGCLALEASGENPRHARGAEPGQP